MRRGQGMKLMSGSLAGLKTVLRQESASAESRAVGQACRMLDIQTTMCALERLEDVAEGLRAGWAMPVGSVQFLREAMRVAGLKEPAGMSYPPALAWMMKRRWRQTVAAEVIAGEFVKPVATKAFTGFVVPGLRDEHALDAHEKEQLEALRGLPESTAVYACERVTWLCEWRIYVHAGLEVGRERYDPDGREDAPLPAELVVGQAIADMVRTYGQEATFALDVGVLSNGETALVEVNDAFAVGLYGRSLTVSQYLEMLWTRWKQIASAG